jgi:hypothetical protein
LEKEKYHATLPRELGGKHGEETKEDGEGREKGRKEN